VGVFEAAVEADKRAIGVDSDQWQTAPADQQAVIMTSMLKRVDNAVEAFITDFSEGSVEGATDITNDLSTDGVGLSDSGGFIADIQDVIDDYSSQIVSGEITVPTTP
jgi:basic membrane protein A